MTFEVHQSLRLLLGVPAPVLLCAVVSFLDKRQLSEPSSQVFINHTAISGRSFDVDISHKRSSGFFAHVRASERKCVYQQLFHPMSGHLAGPPARRWLPGQQAPQSGRGKPPAAAHAAVAGPRGRQAPAACGASTRRTRPASKSAPYQCW